MKPLDANQARDPDEKTGTSGTSGKKELNLFSHSIPKAPTQAKLNHHSETIPPLWQRRVSALRTERPNPLATQVGEDWEPNETSGNAPHQRRFVPYCGKSGHLAQGCPKALAAKLVLRLWSLTTQRIQKLVRNTECYTA